MPTPVLQASGPFDRLRRNMVDNQLRTFDVTDRAVLAAMGSVPREVFVPAGLASLAYVDRNLDVAGEDGARRAMLQPMVLARLIQALGIQAGERVLDVGGGYGYGAAILRALGAEVVALESDDELAAAARTRLDAASAGAVTVRAGSLAAGVPDLAPFDAALLEGAAEERPDVILGQLGPNGRLACLQRDAGGCRAVLHVRSGDALGFRALFDASAPTLPGFARPASFVF